ncbi:hypothetical protein E2I00_005643 [Balaenoptera physalus]|uniref:Uncharacterized protein n=1 Tax=Balaenoptera physalus TaxID=9770 RepID=A0A643CHR2_BALPH|nr:hypothetical protein E2I00_005643 [Balaenoptera physalus]
MAAPELEVQSLAEDMEKKPLATAEASSRKCQHTLAELEGVLRHLEGLFAWSLEPQVLMLLGGNALTIFTAGALSELQPPPLMGTIVTAQGHRDCGEDWSRPKLNYRVPSPDHKLTVTMFCG